MCSKGLGYSNPLNPPSVAPETQKACTVVARLIVHLLIVDLPRWWISGVCWVYLYSTYTSIYIYTAGIFIGWMKKTITVLPDLPLLFGCGSSDRQWNDGVKYAPRWKKNQWQFQVSKLEVSTIIFLAHLIGLCKGIYYIYPPIYIYGYIWDSTSILDLGIPLWLDNPNSILFYRGILADPLSTMATASINWCSMRY